MNMNGEKNLNILLKSLKPRLNNGNYVFCMVNNPEEIQFKNAILVFREQEGYTVIYPKDIADSLHTSYSFVASWITLDVHSALDAVGLTAAFSDALSKHGISCNVVAAYFHDHIFIDKKDTDRAMEVLKNLSNKD